jgi:hypothetical protein
MVSISQVMETLGIGLLMEMADELQRIDRGEGVLWDAFDGRATHLIGEMKSRIKSIGIDAMRFIAKKTRVTFVKKKKKKKKKKDFFFFCVLNVRNECKKPKEPSQFKRILCVEKKKNSRGN